MKFASMRNVAVAAIVVVGAVAGLFVVMSNSTGERAADRQTPAISQSATSQRSTSQAAAPRPTGAEVPPGLTFLPDTPLAGDFELTNLDGKKVRLSDFKGKVVMINFWATWCPPCRREMPSMERAWKELQANDVMMLAVHVGGNEDSVWAFAAEFDITFPVLIDGDSRVTDRWKLKGLPSTFIIDPQGRVVYRAVGAREWDSPDLLGAIFALRG